MIRRQPGHTAFLACEAECVRVRIIVRRYTLEQFDDTQTIAQAVAQARAKGAAAAAGTVPIGAANRRAAVAEAAVHKR